MDGAPHPCLKRNGTERAPAIKKHSPHLYSLHGGAFSRLQQPNISRWRTPQTKAYAIAKPAQTTRKITLNQQLEKTVLNLRSQEVSRETARKTPKFVRYDICRVGEVRRFKRKTPQNMALSGVFIFAAESLQPVSWRQEGM